MRSMWGTILAVTGKIVPHCYEQPNFISLLFFNL